MIAGVATDTRADAAFAVDTCSGGAEDDGSACFRIFVARWSLLFNGCAAARFRCDGGDQHIPYGRCLPWPCSHALVLNVSTIMPPAMQRIPCTRKRFAFLSM